MEKPTISDFHLAMYSKYPGISFESCLELYYAQYPEEKKEDPKPTETDSKTEKKSKK